ncbi:MAG: hypothetical protein H7831_02640 [Magnetococcus sp. WYHC-3]
MLLPLLQRWMGGKGLGASPPEAVRVASLPLVEALLREPEEIQRQLLRLMEEDLLIQIRLDELIYDYHAFLDDGARATALLMQRQALLLNYLEPPSANDRLRQARTVHLCFSDGLYLMRAQVPYGGHLDDMTVRLGFPEVLERTPERRSSLRLPVPESASMFLRVTRPSGMAFYARLEDMSLGGAAMRPLRGAARIARKAHVTLELAYPGCPLCEIAGVVVGDKPGDGDVPPGLRVKFMAENYVQIRVIEDAFAQVQRAILQNRAKTRALGAEGGAGAG